jgi:hypothetical protein
VYLLALVESPKSEILRLDKAHFVLAYLYEVEEQVATAAELRAIPMRHFPKPYYPQTPVMVTREWSPISAMLEGGLNPLNLVREPRRRAIASGIWEPTTIENVRPYAECETAEQLYWSVLDKVSRRAKVRGLLVSLISAIGWDYESSIGMPKNLTLAEAEQADRVIWQRTPIPHHGSNR